MFFDAMNNFDMVQLTAYFPKRCLCFGAWQEGHMRSERWLPRIAAQEIIDFAKKVQAVGGFFYMQGRKFRHVEVWPGTPKAYSIIQRDGYTGPVSAPSATAAAWTGIIKARYLGPKKAPLPFGCMDAEGAAGDPATIHSQAQKLYVPVTRKVSLTPETKDGKSGA